MPIWKLPQRFAGVPRGELAEIFPEFDPYPSGAAAAQARERLWQVARDTDMALTYDAWRDSLFVHAMGSDLPMRWIYNTVE